MSDSLDKEKSSGSEAVASKVKSLSENKSWYQDRYQMAVVQRNVLFFLAVLALLGLGFSVTAVATLNASKVFEPFVIEMENKTGVITQVSNKSVEKYTSDELVIRYFLVKYLQSRESYNADDYEYFYSEVVRLLSSRPVYRSFQSEIATTNELSPINLARTAMREVEIKSISNLGANADGTKKWQVRFAVHEYEMPVRTLRETVHYISTINFDFLDLDLSQQQRYINPLGFQIKSYRRDREDT